MYQSIDRIHRIQTLHSLTVILQKSIINWILEQPTFLLLYHN